jgi:hypothetical protein
VGLEALLADVTPWYVEFDKGFDRDDFISLLAYMGFINLYRKTLAGEAAACRLLIKFKHEVC